MLVGCHKHEEELVPAKPTPQATETVVIIYMVSENSLDNYTQGDLTEMSKGKGNIPQGSRVVIYHDGATNHTLPTITELNSAEDMALIKELPEQNSCNKDVFLSNLRTIIDLYPAQHYRLLMWSHGSGWVSTPKRTIGIDNNTNKSNLDRGSELEIADMRWALEQLGIHWDWIFFDACFMQCVESDYELRHLTDYIVAAPCEIPAEGAPYDKIMSSMFLTSPQESATSIATNYHAQYQPTYGVLLSVVDCSKLEDLAKATATLVPNIWANRKQYDLSGIQRYCPWVTEDSRTLGKPEYYDMASTLHSLLGSEGDYATWWEALCTAVPIRLASNRWGTGYIFDARLTDPEHYAGMSMFVPNSKYNIDGHNIFFHTFEWYKAAAWDQTGW